MTRKRGSNWLGENTTLKVGVIVLVALLVFGGLYYSGHMTPSTSSNKQLYLMGTVTYSDGSTQTFDTRTMPLDTLSLTTQSGATINSINTNAYMTVFYQGTPSSYVLSGTFGVSIQDMATQAYVYTYTMPLTPTSTPTLQNGAALLISSSTITAGQLTSLYGGWVSGRTYTLMDSISNAGITITFADGGQASALAGTSSIKLVFTYH